MILFQTAAADLCGAAAADSLGAKFPLVSRLAKKKKKTEILKVYIDTSV